MNRDHVTELHFITHFDNVASILKQGIYCHNKMKTREHTSVADAAVQLRRASKRVPGGLRLHDYANLYFHARNVMLYVMPDKDSVALLRIDPQVMDLENVVISDRNAASGAALFRPVNPGLEMLHEEDVYAEWWNTSYDARQKRCAEVLIPSRVAPQFVTGAYVASESAKLKLVELINGAIPIEVDGHMFYRGSGK